ERHARQNGTPPQPLRHIGNGEHGRFGHGSVITRATRGVVDPEVPHHTLHLDLATGEVHRDRLGPEHVLAATECGGALEHHSIQRAIEVGAIGCGVQLGPGEYHRAAGVGTHDATVVVVG